MSKQMKLEEAMMYCLVTEGRGLSVPQLTYLINREKLHKRKDGNPVAFGPDCKDNFKGRIPR